MYQCGAILPPASRAILQIASSKQNNLQEAICKIALQQKQTSEVQQNFGSLKL